MKKVYIETMGCQMNKSDSERMFGMLAHFDYEKIKLSALLEYGGSGKKLQNRI